MFLYKQVYVQWKKQVSFFSLGTNFSLKEKKKYFNTFLETQGLVSEIDEPNEP